MMKMTRKKKKKKKKRRRKKRLNLKIRYGKSKNLGVKLVYSSSNSITNHDFSLVKTLAFII
jgi:hypothetical protein